MNDTIDDNLLETNYMSIGDPLINPYDNPNHFLFKKNVKPEFVHLFETYFQSIYNSRFKWFNPDLFPNVTVNRGKTSYFVCSDGERIISTEFGGFVEIQRPFAEGYKIVRLHSTNLSVHRVVAILFIDNPNNLPQVDHANNDKGDNDVSNLRWVTPTQNAIYYQELNPSPLSVSVNMYEVGNFDTILATYVSIGLAARTTGINQRTIKSQLLKHRLGKFKRSKQKYEDKFVTFRESFRAYWQNQDI